MVVLVVLPVPITKLCSTVLPLQAPALKLAAAAATVTVVPAPCGLTVVAGVATLRHCGIAVCYGGAATAVTVPCGRTVVAGVAVCYGGGGSCTHT
jgi:hypothetical protein